MPIQTFAPSWRNTKFLWVIAGILFGTKINLVGEIYIGEILAIAALPSLLSKGRISREFVFVIALAVSWSIAQAISDIQNETELLSSLKGIFSPVVFGSTIVFLISLMKNHVDRMASILIGILIAKLIAVAIFPTEYQISQPWKWGYGSIALSIGLIYASFLRRSNALQISLFMAVFAVVCILNSSRSLAVLPLFGYAIYLFWKSSLFPKSKRFLVGRMAPIRVAIPIFAFATIVNVLFTFLFSTYWLDPYLEESTASKYKQQAASPAGLLLSGRSETLVSVQAFMDSPIFGHGSWAQDKSGYLAQYATLLYKYGINDDIQEIDQTLIPAHSFLFGSLVWSGIVGGLFWIILTYRVVNAYLRYPTYIPVYFHVGLVIYLWNVLFSPFGADGRWPTSIFIAVLFAYVSSLNSPDQSSSRSHS